MASPTSFATWIFLYENTESPKYYLEHATIPKNEVCDLRLLDFLERVKIRGDIGDFAFFMHAQTMKYPRALKNDDSILEAWRKHCREVEIVTIYIRLETDASPAEKRTPSSTASFAARQKLVAIDVPDYTVVAQPVTRPAPKMSTYPGVHGEQSVHMVWTSNGTWAERRELQDLRIQIRTGETSFRHLPAKCLLMIIREQCLRGIPITDIELPFYTFLEGRPAYSSVRLSKEIWEESLLRGPWEDLFSVFCMREAVEQVESGKGPTILPQPPSPQEGSGYTSQVADDDIKSEEGIKSE